MNNTYFVKQPGKGLPSTDLLRQGPGYDTKQQQQVSGYIQRPFEPTYNGQTKK